MAFDHDRQPNQSETDTIPNVAKRLKARGQPWALIVDENYGEGSAREHAALQPRFYGCALILARSFARIHETNLKKQGMLALTFANPEDYEKVRPDDRVDILGLESFEPGRELVLVLLLLSPADL